MKPCHYNIPGHIHALSFSCYQNRKFLNYNRTRKYFADAINSARIKHNFLVYAWVIMPEHVHLIIHPQNEDYSISDILKSIKQPVARRAITYLKNANSPILKLLETGNDSPKWRFWQNGGGYDRNIRDNDEFARLINYIHDNPVKRGLVENRGDWEWSSAWEQVENEQRLIVIDEILL